MQIKGFQKMEAKEMNSTYGGWAWLVALVPLLVQSLVSAVGSFKAIGSNSGSIKGKNFETHWDDNSKKTEANKVMYFAY